MSANYSKPLIPRKSSLHTKKLWYGWHKQLRFHSTYFQWETVLNILLQSRSIKNTFMLNRLRLKYISMQRMVRSIVFPSNWFSTENARAVCILKHSNIPVKTVSYYCFWTHRWPNFYIGITHSALFRQNE